jgi:hypothetical protein
VALATEGICPRLLAPFFGELENIDEMNVKIIFWLALIVSCVYPSNAQDLTVHMIDRDTKQPIGNALIRLHYGCWHSMRPVELKQKTDAAGTAVFNSVTLSPLEFCVFPDYAYASQEQTVVFTSPSEGQNYSKYQGRIFTSLPTEITFHVRRLSFIERLRNLLRYD